jgi:hypothetical protein
MSAIYSPQVQSSHEVRIGKFSLKKRKCLGKQFAGRENSPFSQESIMTQDMSNLRNRGARPVRLGIAVLAAVAAGATVWFCWPAPKYKAQALIHVARPVPLLEPSPKQPAFNLEQYKHNQAALIKSRLVLNRALAQHGSKLQTVRAQADPVLWLEQAIEIDFEESPEILRISLQGDKPEDLEALVNSVTKVFLNEFVEKERDKSAERWDQLKRLQNRFEEKILAKKKILEELKRVTGAGDAATRNLKQMIAEKQLDLAIKELAQLRSDIRRLRAGIEPAGVFVYFSLFQPGFFMGNLASAGFLAGKDDMRILNPKLSTMLRVEKMLQADIQQLVMDRQPDANAPTFDFEILQDDIQRLDESFKKLGKEIEALELARMAPLPVSQLESAVVRRLEPDKLRYWLTGLAALGILIFVLVVFAWMGPRSSKAMA